MNNDILRNTAEALFAAEEGGPSYIGLRESVRTLVDQLLAALFPRHIGAGCIDSPEVRRVRLATAEATLYSVLSFVLPEGADIEEIADGFLAELPEILAVLKTDIRAAYEGDPAARSAEEIMLSYPGFEAISIYRIAHLLHTLGAPLLPRMMTEYAHRQTGVDIHPGATIGRYFFIDHATGVVVGETCTIGDHVKLYQGVTLGAKSFELDENGNPVKGIKRHPDIGSHVVIYANATILGGNTVIGDGCVIGGSVWLTHSVPPGTTVYYSGNEQNKIV